MNGHPELQEQSDKASLLLLLFICMRTRLRPWGLGDMIVKAPAITVTACAAGPCDD